MQKETEEKSGQLSTLDVRQLRSDLILRKDPFWTNLNEMDSCIKTYITI